MKQLSWILWSLAGAAFIGALTWSWTHMPDMVPSHFDLSGRGDRWAPKESHLAIVGGLGAIMHVGAPLLAYGLCRGEGIGINVSHRDYWFADEHRAAELRSRLMAALALLAAIVISFMSFSLVESAIVSHDRVPKITPTWIEVPIALSTISLWLWLANRWARPPQGRGGGPALG